MKTLKDFVKMYTHLEGSIVEGYRMDDTMRFCTEYMKQYTGTTQHVWDIDVDPIMTNEIPRPRALGK